MLDDEDFLGDHFPELWEESLSRVAVILEDCPEFFLLNSYVNVFTERFENGKKKEDLDRLISVLRGLLKLTREQGLTDDHRRTAGLMFTECLLMRYNLTTNSEVNDPINEESIFDDRFPPLWNLKESLSDMNDILRDCQELDTLLLSFVIFHE